MEDKSLRFLLDLLEQRADPGPGQCATQTKQKQSEAMVYSNGGAYSRLEQVGVGDRGTCLVLMFQDWKESHAAYKVLEAKRVNQSKMLIKSISKSQFGLGKQ